MLTLDHGGELEVAATSNAKLMLVTYSAVVKYLLTKRAV